MSRLSDNFGHIGDRWVIKGGRYAASGSMNQGLLSTAGRLIWAIEGIVQDRFFESDFDRVIKQIESGSQPDIAEE